MVATCRKRISALPFFPSGEAGVEERDTSYKQDERHDKAQHGGALTPQRECREEVVAHGKRKHVGTGGWIHVQQREDILRVL